jgi:hypothetical protein
VVGGLAASEGMALCHGADWTDRTDRTYTTYMLMIDFWKSAPVLPSVEGH